MIPTPATYFTSVTVGSVWSNDATGAGRLVANGAAAVAAGADRRAVCVFVVRADDVAGGTFDASTCTCIGAASTVSYHFDVDPATQAVRRPRCEVVSE